MQNSCTVKDSIAFAIRHHTPLERTEVLKGGVEWRKADALRPSYPCVRFTKQGRAPRFGCPGGISQRRKQGGEYHFGQIRSCLRRGLK